MYRITVLSGFSAAHKLINYKGRCEKLHGHNWKVQAVVSCSRLDRTGMTIDFHRLKHELNKVIDAFDHKYLNDIKPFKKMNPTSENIAKYIFESLSKLVNDKRIKLKSATVWETDTSCATYTQ